MKPEMKETIAAAARAFQLPAYPDIPDVGLYLERLDEMLERKRRAIRCH